MRTRDLRIFVTVCEERSFTETARKLYLAQPSISRTIAALEAEYGEIFFERTVKPVQLTESGNAFLAYARRMLDMETELKDELKSRSGRMKIRLGSSITMGTYVLPQLIKDLEEKRKDLEIQVVIDNSRRIIERIEDNTIDLGLVEHMEEHPMIKVKSIMTDRMIMVASKDNPIASMIHDDLSDLRKERFVLRERGSASRDSLDALMQKAQVEMNLAWESISNEALVKAVEQNIGITALSEYIVEEQLKSGSLREIVIRGVEMRRYFHLIYHEKKVMNQGLQDVMDMLISSLAKYQDQV